MYIENIYLVKFKTKFNIENLKKYKFIYNNITNILHSKKHIPEIIY